MNLKWVTIGGYAYPICPKCGAFLRYYGECQKIHVLVCEKCTIAVLRKTPFEKLQKRAVQRFWGKKNVN